MLARDVMVSQVITVKPYFSIKSVADVFGRHHISGAPVLDDKGKIVGMITEGDLVCRSELKTDRAHPYWFLHVAGKENLAREYTKSHGKHVADVMSTSVITASPDTSLGEIAKLMERHFIKRIPIVENNQLVGIVTRANLVQALASAPREIDFTLSDFTIRSKLLTELKAQSWADASRLNIIVHDGVVELWGIVSTEAEKQAVRVAAEASPGVCAVQNHLRVVPVELPPMVVPPDVAIR